METLNAKEVIDWAKDFLQKSENEITAEELKEQKKYAILMQNPNDKTLLSKLLDESSQIRNNRKLALRMKVLIKRYGVPVFFSYLDNFLLRLFTLFGSIFHFVSVPLFKRRLRADTAKVIINENPAILSKHLSERKKQKIGQNVNLLGEVVLGDGEAEKRFQHYLQALNDSSINYISIKISSIYAQINPLNYAQNKIDLCEKVASIYRQSVVNSYLDENKILTPKFVNLDMEEYKDIELTMDVFMTVLSQPEFLNYRAGIVVQTYLPDAWSLQTQLLNFAKKRVDQGGAPLKMRLVKGANLQMESIVSSIKGWENPVLKSKIEVDANYLHILDRALEPENANVLNVGVASHNFFSIGYAYLLSKKNKVQDAVTFEMLEGMANHLPRVLRSMDKQIILYTPVVKDEYFLNAISYLIRRLDENTRKDNFLSYSFNLRYDSKEWNFLRNQFSEAYKLKDQLNFSSFRTQDRHIHLNLSNEEIDSWKFKNEPDTDFCLKQNKEWADEIRTLWKKSPSTKPYQIPVQLGDRVVITENNNSYYDRSQQTAICVCQTSLSNLEHVTEMVSIAESDVSKWRSTTLVMRNRILHRVADNLAKERGNLIGCMTAITGKTFLEGDVEVSEAIDFCRYYPISMKTFDTLETVSCEPKGIVLVIPPWNFPLAIPVGGVAAALAAGNTVILKPATVALPVAWEFAKCFWEAGVPKDALQIVCTDGREPLAYLTSHPSIKHIILTGGTDTAFKLLENNPACPLSAETGGKNVIILTSYGDRDHAIQNVVNSAFGNSGQKCSACSLFLVEKDVYYDLNFKMKLTDAVKSIKVGGAWDGGNVVGPMISAENEKLLHALNYMEEGESWLVAPEFVDENHFILKPSVKWGVKPTSYMFKNELFGPLLGVVCIENLEEGIKYVNSLEYGLTSGLQSLDEAEQLQWKNSIEAGNLYINRSITGAIVQRQPFGGMKRSAFGGGIKTGGRNYVSCFVNLIEKEQQIKSVSNNIMFRGLSLMLKVHDNYRFQAAINSYLKNWKEEFSVENESCKLMGEKNTFRYLPIKDMILRIHETDNIVDIFLVIVAANITGVKLTLSINADDKKGDVLKNTITTECNILIQNETEFIHVLPSYERVRTCTNRISIAIYKEAAKYGKYIATEKPLAEGRIELLHYVKEQTISYEFHRYGSFEEGL